MGDILLSGISLDLRSHDDINALVCKKTKTFVESLARPSVRNLYCQVRGCYDCLPFTLIACSSLPVTYGLHYHWRSSMWDYRRHIPSATNIAYITVFASPSY